MRSILPASAPPVGPEVLKRLRSLGAQIRSHRKRLGVNATATAESAGMSRVTLHRIERGEPSVAMGAYLSVLSSLGLELLLKDSALKKRGRKITPESTVRIAAYPQLKRLAWQLKGTQSLPAAEALSLYERNWRHVEAARLSAREREFIRSLLEAFGREKLLV
jgi:transcriptional regulator with XRE-family HTH domain